MKRLIAIIAVAAMLLTMLVSAPVTAKSTEIHVPDDYATIQAAVDNATAGDTIIVHAGTYNENVHVYKSLTVQAAAGEDMPVVDGELNNFAFLITANDVTVQGFDVRCEGTNVITVDLADNVIISNNEVTGGEKLAIGLDTANECEVIDNEVSSPSGHGIRAKDSSGNLISGNMISGSMDNGITLADGANDNEVTENEISDSGEGMPSIEVGSDVGPMAIAPDGKIYAAVSLWDDENENDEVDLPDERSIVVWISENNSYTWDDSDLELDFEPENIIVQIVISPNFEEDEIIYVGTYGGTIYRLEEEGWGDVVPLPDIPDVDELYSIDTWYDGDDNWVLAGTDDGVFEMMDANGGDWVDYQLGGSRGLEVAYAPDFDDEELIWVITEDGGNFLITSTVSPGQWGQVIGEAQTDIAASPWVDLDFPDDYSSDVENEIPVVFAALSSDDGGGVYLIEGAEAPSNSVATELMDDENIVSIAVSGELDDAIILAGALETPTVYIGEDGGDDWSEADENPTGDWLTHVYMEADVVWDEEVFDPDDGMAFASTSGDDPEGILDGSAVFRSEDGGFTWSWRGIIDAELDVVETGIRVEDSNGNLIGKNNIFNTGRRGILLREASGNNIMKNEVRGPTMVGIRVRDSDGNLIMKNEISNSCIDLHLESANSNKIFKNEVSDPGEVGIELEESAGNFIKDNEVSDSGNVGINLGESDGNKVIKNEVFNCEGEGISLHSESSDNLIKWNNVTGNDFGIEIINGANGNEFTENEILDSGDIGILLNDAHDNDVVDNKISGSGRFGIRVEEATENHISQNQVSGSGRFGIFVEEATENHISQNQVSGSGRFGIFVEEATENHISQNQVSDSGEFGIRLVNAHQNEIRENVVLDSGEFGIELDNANNNEVIENEVLDSGQWGVAVISGSSDNSIEENEVFGSGEWDLYWDFSGSDNTWLDNDYGTSNF